MQDDNEYESINNHGNTAKPKSATKKLKKTKANSKKNDNKKHKTMDDQQELSDTEVSDFSSQRAAQSPGGIHDDQLSVGDWRDACFIDY